MATIDEFVSAAAVQLGAASLEYGVGRPVHVDFQPGNGCRYDIFLSPPLTGEREGVIALPEYRVSWWANPAGFPAPSYVTEKLKLTGQDAIAVSTAWSLLLGHDLDKVAAMLRNTPDAEHLVSYWKALT